MEVRKLRRQQYLFNDFHKLEDLCKVSNKYPRQEDMFCLKLSNDRPCCRFWSVAGCKLSQEEGWKQEVEGSDDETFWEDHKLSQLTAGRLLLNSDPVRCTFILQWDLVLFIKPHVVLSAVHSLK